uniref:Uncharacterized protein n=1 Tax=Rhizophagus irregularis (strain DAOM 181602 / DAOM 197198 / MUCL 43194) TaxID=747089 RepID=U9SU19_RHIID
MCKNFEIANKEGTLNFSMNFEITRKNTLDFGIDYEITNRMGSQLGFEITRRNI